MVGSDVFVFPIEMTSLFRGHVSFRGGFSVMNSSKQPQRCRWPMAPKDQPTEGWGQPIVQTRPGPPSDSVENMLMGDIFGMNPQRNSSKCGDVVTVAVARGASQGLS